VSYGRPVIPVEVSGLQEGGLPGHRLRLGIPAYALGQLLRQARYEPSSSILGIIPSLHIVQIHRVVGESRPPYLKAAFSQAPATLTVRVIPAVICLLPNGLVAYHLHLTCLWS
jgi:hypothetical protein